MIHRGDVWLCDFNPTRGHEQAGLRPALVLSTEQFNCTPLGLVFVAPMTTKQRNSPFHIHIAPPEGGVRQDSFIMSEQVRVISTDRLTAHWGSVETETLVSVARILSMILQL
ncbi:MAG: type II toxin-antitoxin system PemK/MazF family toxin [Armatimonadetes bacterium]|nr:type II toxin-antitoxin system PemK/MazF family toxin [Armatimonadota bacterium]